MIAHVCVIDVYDTLVQVISPFKKVDSNLFKGFCINSMVTIENALGRNHMHVLFNYFTTKMIELHA